MKAYAGLLAVFAGVASASGAAPEITAMNVSQDSSRNAVVTYTLSHAPAVVTVSFETNHVNDAGEKIWTPIPSGTVLSLSGEVGKLVQAGSRSFKWKVRDDWPGMKLAAGTVRAKLTAWATNSPPDYVVVDLGKSEDAIRYYADIGDVPGGVSDSVYKLGKLLMRRIRAANVRWRMGSPEYESGHNRYTEIPRIVTLSRDYYIGVYEFTKRQYELVAGFPGSAVGNAKPGTGHDLVNGGMRPVDMIIPGDLRGTGAAYTWPDTMHAVNPALPMGLLRGRYGFEFDLPTSAQWEYAARAGTTSAYLSGDNSKDKMAQLRDGLHHVLDDWGWYHGNNTNDLDGVEYDWGYWNADKSRVAEVNNGRYTHVVGKLRHNAWGLYDMMGNVGEYCLDWYSKSDNFVPPGEVTDPVGPSAPSAEANSATRIWAGGCCTSGGVGSYPSYLRSASRYGYPARLAGVGFRICCPAVAH